MVYKLVLGDWSEDGHGKSKDFLFDCNYDVSKIRQAYKDSCKKLGISLISIKWYGLPSKSLSIPSIKVQSRFK